MVIENKNIQRVAYLSGAPRISTRDDATGGGPRSHILGVIKGFKENGWVVYPYIVGDRIPARTDTKTMKSILEFNYLTRIIADIFRYFSGIYQSRKAIREIGNVDAVYERFGSFQSLGKIFQKNGATWILETNGPFYHEAYYERKSIALKWLAKLLEQQAYRDCDVLVCVTEELRKIIIHEMGINPQKIIVIPNGVDTEFFSPTNHNPIRYFPYPTVGYVGSIIQRQGLEQLILAVSQLEKEGIFFHLVFVGDGSAKDNLLRLVRDLQMDNRVIFTGQKKRSEIPSIILGFDYGYSGQIAFDKNILSSMYHSPLKLYEYLAMGKPVIAAKYEDADHVIQDQINGFLFTPGDFNSLVRCLRRSWESRQKYENIANNALLSVINNHNWGHRVDYLIHSMEIIHNNQNKVK